MDYFILCHKSDDVSGIAYLYFKEVIRLHVVPRSIISDRDTKFLFHFWRRLWRLLGTKILFNSTRHPQIDGQIEVTNQTLSTSLRGFVRKNLKEWDFKASSC